MKNISKLLSYILRHNPGSIDLSLDPAGWASVDAIMRRLHLTKEQLDDVVANNNKKRFEYSEDGKLIRARQGHSVDVNLGYTQTEPPEFLYHGTANTSLDNIFVSGIKKMSRHHVHLSPDEQTAKNVGGRHGKPVVLRINAKQMHADGAVFFKTENEVWLTDYVDPKYIVINP